LIGGMSFGVSGIHTKKEISGWYYLLNETMARKKHLRAGAEAQLASSDGPKSNQRDCAPILTQSDNSPQRMESVGPPGTPATTGQMNTLERSAGLCLAQQSMGNSVGPRLTSPMISPPNARFPSTSMQFQNPSFSSAAPPGSPQVAITVPKTNQALNNMHLFRFLLARGPKGFGFTLSGGCPVYVSHVEPNSPALQAGVQPGDFIVAVDSINVSRSTTDSVVRIFRMAQNPVYLTVCRPTTVCIKTQSSPRAYGSKAFSNLFQRGCLSHMKKSASNDSMRLDCASGFYHSAPGLPMTPPAPVYGTAILSCIGPSQPVQPNGPPAYPGLTILPNSRSLYQLSPNLQTPRTGTPMFPTSKTEMHLCDVANGAGTNQLAVSQVPPTPTNIPIAKPRLISLPPACNQNTYNRSEGCRTNNTVENVGSIKQIPPSPLALTSPRPPNICSPVPSPTAQTAPTFSMQPRFPYHGLSPPSSSALPTDQPIVDCLKYVSHVKQVDFRQHSPRLEHYGCLNLLESNCCSKVELLMFTDLLLIAQRAPNHFLTVIKDPIYNTKICYVNIPPNASDQLILQYIDDHNRKQIVHFQGSNVREWLAWIQGHMVYNGNWWMSNIHCPVNF
uniref:PDZ domain-containing protein n=1 Tax=Echinostoma caproni TaxID=27848 RepID=A0A183APU1_9TREM